MAKMGQGRMSQKKKVGSELTSPTPGVSVITLTVPIEMTATVVIGSTLGVPIMRDGFVTETGLLPSSMVAPTIAPGSLTRDWSLR
jgi:hypothetical protein